MSKVEEWIFRQYTGPDDLDITTTLGAWMCDYKFIRIL